MQSDQTRSRSHSRLLRYILESIMRTCDRCGGRIKEKDLRYIAKIQVYAAADPIEIKEKDLMRDYTAEIEELLRQCEAMTEEELMRDVYVEFRFILCRSCQKEYIAQPLSATKTSAKRKRG